MWLVKIIFMVFNTTSNNISVISWRSVILVEKTGVPRENHRPTASHWQTLSHYDVSSTPHMSRIWTPVSGDRYWLHRVKIMWTKDILIWYLKYMCVTLTSQLIIIYDLQQQSSSRHTLLNGWINLIKPKSPTCINR